MHVITEKLKWRTDLVLRVKHGNQVERLIRKLTTSLTLIGFFVVEFKTGRCGHTPFHVLANLFARFNIPPSKF